MSKLNKLGQKRSGTSKLLPLSFPDPETAAFWRMTADDLNEYARRIAKFSRAVGGETIRNVVKPSGRRWREVASAARSRHPPARLLVMPRLADLSSPSSRQGSNPRFWESSRWRAPIGCNDIKTRTLNQGGNMKAPGMRARKRGTKIKRGAATQVMIYPRLKTKGVLVAASRDISRPLSSFIILAALKEAAALRGCEIKDLIPADELEMYRKSRVYRKRSKAAQ
jgi:hypothetical protein